MDEDNPIPAKPRFDGDDLELSMVHDRLNTSKRVGVKATLIHQVGGDSSLQHNFETIKKESRMNQ